MGAPEETPSLRTYLRNWPIVLCHAIAPQLAGPLVLAIVLARMYRSTVDASAIPQVSPLRLDLWLLVLVGVLAGGLRRWPVGLVLGLLWALALAGDFLADRFATRAGERPPVRAALRLALVDIGPSLGLIALSLVAALAVSGHLGADGLSLYGHLGAGMMRIGRDSFYWWLLPLLGMAGWLAFAQRRSLPSARAQAALMAVALLVANAIYFFRRSAEQNLINLAGSFLFGLFLVLDLSWPSSPSNSNSSTDTIRPSSAGLSGWRPIWWSSSAPTATPRAWSPSSTCRRRWRSATAR